MKLRSVVVYFLLVISPAMRAAAANLPSGTTANSYLTILPTADSHQGQLKLTWVGDSSATGFQIERSTDGANFTQIAQVLYPMTSYCDTGLNVGTKYYYRVRAYNSSGVSAYSAPNSGIDLVSPPARSLLMRWDIRRPPGLSSSVITCVTLQQSTNMTQFVDLAGCQTCDTKNFTYSIVVPTTNRVGFYRLKMSEM
jgi:hypothetical protein